MKSGPAVARTLALFTRLVSSLSVVVAPAVAASVLVACADENDPMTWVKRLEDPKDKDAAVVRLGQFFETAMTKANQDRNNKDVIALLDKIAEPLSKTYAAGNLPDGTRKKLIKQFVQMRDARTQPALAKALASFDPGKNDEETRDAAEALKWIAKGGAKIDAATADALWGAFLKVRVSQSRLYELVRQIHDAILEVKHESYGDKAIAKLNEEVKEDAPPDVLRDQFEYWQLTSVQVIRDLKFEKALPALTVALINPAKAPLSGTIRSAFRQMPLKAEDALIKAMVSPDDAIKKVVAANEKLDTIKNKAYVAILADALADIARPKGRDAILDMLKASGDKPADKPAPPKPGEKPADKPAGDNHTLRFGLAQALIHFPKDDKAVAAFKDVMDKMPADASVPFTAIPPKIALAQASSNLFDASLVEVLLKDAAKVTDARYRMIYIDTAAKLMNAAQKGAVEDAVKKLEADLLKDAKTKEAAANIRAVFGLMAQQVDKCADKSDCYLGVLAEPIPAKPEYSNQKAVKAAYMAAMTAGANADKVRADLVAKMAKVTDNVTLVAMAIAVAYLAPQGDVKAAEALEKLVESDTKAGTAKKANDDIKKVAERLRARAAK